MYLFSTLPHHIPNACRYFFDTMKVFGTRCEHTDAATFRFNGRFGAIIGSIYEQKTSASKLFFVVAQIQQTCIVERTIRLLIHMRMPVLIMHRFGRSICDPREKCRMRQVQTVRLNAESFGNRFLNSLSYILIEQKKNQVVQKIILALLLNKY